MSKEVHTHVDENGNVITHHHHHDPNDVTDYIVAVKAYR